jgi:hypothetical protein
MTDEELEKIQQRTIVDIFSALNPNYVELLESRYLGENKVIEYISEEVYYLLSVAAMTRNDNKIDSIVSKRNASIIRDLNNE